MVEATSPQDRQPILDEERQLFDPTGQLEAVPADPALISWMRTAYLVRKALEENPDSAYLVDGQSIIEEAITRRQQDLRHQRLYPPQS